MGVPELAASDPEALVVAELEDTLEMVRTIGEVCELDAVTKFFNANPSSARCRRGAAPSRAARASNVGPDRHRHREGWDDVLDAIDTIVATPEVIPTAVAVAEAELVAADENIVDADDAAEEADEDDDLEFVRRPRRRHRRRSRLPRRTSRSGVRSASTRSRSSRRRRSTSRCAATSTTTPIFLGESTARSSSSPPSARWPATWPTTTSTTSRR